MTNQVKSANLIKPPIPINQNIMSNPQVNNSQVSTKITNNSQVSDIPRVSNNEPVNNNSILDKFNIDKSTLIIIFVIILLLIFLGVMYYYFSKKKENKEQSSTPLENTNPGGIETVPQSEQESSDSPRPSIEPFINYLEGDFEPCRPDMYTNDINKLLPGLLV